MFNLQAAIENAGYETRSYSGRGMYGKQCLGVVSENTIETIVDILRWAFSEGTTENDDLYYALSKAMQSAKTDSMGQGYIIYFPDHEYK